MAQTVFDSSTTKGQALTGINANFTEVYSTLSGKAPTAGSASITTLGTITTGTWHGTAIGDSYIASAATWSAKQDALVAGTDYLAPSAAAAAYQPLDSDLSAISALSTTEFGRMFLTLPGAPEARLILAAITGANLMELGAPGSESYLRINGDGSVDMLSQASFRAAIGALGTGSTLAAGDLGSTATGLAVFSASDAAAARTAIGAGVSNFDGAYSNLTGAPTPFDPSSPPVIGDGTPNVITGNVVNATIVMNSLSFVAAEGGYGNQYFTARAGVQLTNFGAISWSSGVVGSANVDTSLKRAAANVLEISAPESAPTGLVFTSPDGTRYKVGVDNGGTISVTAA